MKKKNNTAEVAAGCATIIFGSAALIGILVGVPALIIKLLFF